MFLFGFFRFRLLRIRWWWRFFVDLVWFFLYFDRGRVAGYWREIVGGIGFWLGVLVLNFILRFDVGLVIWLFWVLFLEVAGGGVRSVGGVGEGMFRVVIRFFVFWNGRGWYVVKDCILLRWGYRFYWGYIVGIVEVFICLYGVDVVGEGWV